MEPKDNNTKVIHDEIYEARQALLDGDKDKIDELRAKGYVKSIDLGEVHQFVNSYIRQMKDMYCIIQSEKDSKESCIINNTSMVDNMIYEDHQEAYNKKDYLENLQNEELMKVLKCKMCKLKSCPVWPAEYTKKYLKDIDCDEFEANPNFYDPDELYCKNFHHKPDKYYKYEVKSVRASCYVQGLNNPMTRLKQEYENNNKIE